MIRTWTERKFLDHYELMNWRKFIWKRTFTTLCIYNHYCRHISYLVLVKRCPFIANYSRNFLICGFPKNNLHDFQIHWHLCYVCLYRSTTLCKTRGKSWTSSWGSQEAVQRCSRCRGPCLTTAEKRLQFTVRIWRPNFMQHNTAQFVRSNQNKEVVILSSGQKWNLTQNVHGFGAARVRRRPEPIGLGGVEDVNRSSR